MAIDPRERLTIDLDTGGTFTDGFVSGASGAIRSKVDTTPHDLTEGILHCLDDAAAQVGLGRPQLLRRVEVIRLSTTVGTNTLINRSGAKVGLLLDGPLQQAVAARLPERLPIAKTLIEALPRTSGADAEAATVAALRRLLERGARIVVVALSDGPDLAAREATVRSFIAAEYPRHYLGAVPILPSHEVTLTPDRGGTRVDLEHRDLPPAERPRHASGWTHYLARLQTAAPGRDPGPDPGMPDGCPAGTRWSR